MSTDALTARMIYPMINEAARCLDEKIAIQPRDVDLGMIFGTGFAPFRGGLLTYADTETPLKVRDTLLGFAGQFGDRFQPSSALQIVADSGKGFYDFYAD